MGVWVGVLDSNVVLRAVPVDMCVCACCESREERVVR